MSDFAMVYEVLIPPLIHEKCYTLYQVILVGNFQKKKNVYYLF